MEFANSEKSLRHCKIKFKSEKQIFNLILHYNPCLPIRSWCCCVYGLICINNSQSGRWLVGSIEWEQYAQQSFTKTTILNMSSSSKYLEFKIYCKKLMKLVSFWGFEGRIFFSWEICKGHCQDGQESTLPNKNTLAQRC